MKIVRTSLSKVLIIENEKFEDHRGWFKESYSKVKFNDSGIMADFIQDNHSMSKKKGIIRGLHFQNNPKAQTKLVRCTKGKIFDVVVDLRKGSSTYKKWIGVELSEDDCKQILIPKGFAHGFLVLSEGAEIQYKVDEYYDPKLDRSIRYDDPEVAIKWETEATILSEKDLSAPFLKESDVNFSIKVLVTGASGQLGHDVVGVFNKHQIEATGVDIKDFDITNKDLVLSFVSNYKPDVIIHCAAYTAVDNAECEKDNCFMINVEGTRNIAEAAKMVDAIVVYISSDYVFDGIGSDPFTETKKTNPINYYGYSKAFGEKIIQEINDKFYIVRTSWVYGNNGNNFVKTMMDLSKIKNDIKVVSDQVGSPTYSVDLACFIMELIQTKSFGIYHATNEGYCSWYEFAQAIFEATDTTIKVHPVFSENFPTKAKRPLNSRLSKNNIDKAGIKRLPHWHDALLRFMDELKNKDDKK